MLSFTVIGVLILGIVLFLIGHFSPWRILKFFAIIALILGVWMILIELTTDSSFY